MAPREGTVTWGPWGTWCILRPRGAGPSGVLLSHVGRDRAVRDALGSSRGSWQRICNDVQRREWTTAPAPRAWGSQGSRRTLDLDRHAVGLLELFPGSGGWQRSAGSGRRAVVSRQQRHFPHRLGLPDPRL